MKILIIQITAFDNLSMLHSFPKVGSTVTGEYGDNENYDAKDDGKREGTLSILTLEGFPLCISISFRLCFCC